MADGKIRPGMLRLWTGSLVMLAVLSLLAAAAPSSARAQALAEAPAQSGTSAVHELPYNLKLDLPLTLGALSIWVGTELGKSALAPEDCRWCRTNGFDEGIREGLKWENTTAARRASNWVTVGVLPLGLAAIMSVAAVRDHAADRLPEDLLFISEAVALAGLANQGIKFIAGRERPFVHALPEADKGSTDHPSDNNLSFYSGHTSLAFSMAVAAGTVATMRGYRGAPYVWAVGIPLALLSGYLRIAADRHYMSDVLVGAALGTAFGALTPWLLHRVSPDAGATR
ncbi:MAG: phosphatase PAP2 family protein [Myxococcales bacterium]